MYPARANSASDRGPDEGKHPGAASRAPAIQGDLQRSWLPDDGIVEMPHAVVACHTRSVGAYGGDLCAVYRLGEALLVVVGDVAGHSYDAAMVCAVAKGACDVAVAELRPLTAPRLLHILDRTLRTSSTGRLPMSCSVALVASRTMTVASAGHPLPYIVRDGGRRIEGVRSFGSLLGTSVPTPYRTTTVPLRPGDRVVWYTDGVLETENEAGARFGHRRLRGVLARAHDLDAPDLLAALTAELFWFRGDAPLADDMTLAVAAIR